MLSAVTIETSGIECRRMMRVLFAVRSTVLYSWDLIDWRQVTRKSTAFLEAMEGNARLESRIESALGGLQRFRGRLAALRRTQLLVPLSALRLARRKLALLRLYTKARALHCPHIHYSQYSFSVVRSVYSHTTQDTDTAHLAQAQELEARTPRMAECECRDYRIYAT